jgi:aspartate/methionine/tyrosine aminotransferase
VPRESPFWELVGLHPNLVPVKVDGATKEYSFFGGRVGFVTFACEPGSEMAAALESKVKGSCAPSWARRWRRRRCCSCKRSKPPDAEAQVEAIRVLLAERYRALQQALQKVDERLLRPLPFNSGCFALVELAESLGVTAEEVRLHLLDRFDTGVVSVGQRHFASPSARWPRRRCPSSSAAWSAASPSSPPSAPSAKACLLRPRWRTRQCEHF